MGGKEGWEVALLGPKEKNLGFQAKELELCSWVGWPWKALSKRIDDSDKLGVAC